MPSMPNSDGNDCDLNLALPAIFVTQQVNANSGTLTKYDQNANIMTRSCSNCSNPPSTQAQVTYGPGGSCPHYGASVLDGPINVDVVAPWNPPSQAPRGRVWISLTICGVRVFDAFNLDLCSARACGLGGACDGSTTNQPFCDPNCINVDSSPLACDTPCTPNSRPCPPGCNPPPPCCPSYPCASVNQCSHPSVGNCPTHYDPLQPYWWPFVKGNGSDDFNKLITPCNPPRCDSPGRRNR